MTRPGGDDTRKRGMLMRALIIEDQERLAELIASGLRRAGFAADQMPRSSI